MAFYETAFQGFTFLGFLYTGLIAAFLYDLIRPLLNTPGVLLHAAADILFCTAISVLCFWVLASTGCSTLRIYMVFAFVIGFAVYRLGFRRAVLSVIKIIRKNRKSHIRIE